MSYDIVGYLTSLGIALESDIDQSLFIQACTHKSFSADGPEKKIPYNERLEFLGDSILGGYVAEALYLRYADVAESDLTLFKIWLVREERLAIVARNIWLWAYLRLGNGEERSGGRDKDAVLADALEAFIAYIYLTHGAQSVASFINNHIISQLENLDVLPGKSRKSRLQELIQKRTGALPVYVDYEAEVETTGNVTLYGTRIYVDDVLVGEATGVSKKKAQEAGAEKAYIYLSSPSI